MATYFVAEVSEASSPYVKLLVSSYSIVEVSEVSFSKEKTLMDINFKVAVTKSIDLILEAFETRSLLHFLLYSRDLLTTLFHTRGH